MVLVQEDCIQLLNNVYGNSHSLTNFTLKPFCEELRGYMCEHSLLTINVSTEKDNKTHTYFVKSPFSNLPEFFEQGKYFETELFAYNFFGLVKATLQGTEVDMVPKLCHATKNRVLVLENLAEQGYKDSGLQFDKAHMLKAIEALAKLHVVTIAHEEHMSEKLGRKYEMCDDRKFEDPIFRRCSEHLANKYARSSESGILALLDLFELGNYKAKFSNLVNAAFKIFNEKNDYRKVLSHGDLWANNAIFKYSNGAPIDCKLVDFQFLRYAAPAHDLTMLTYTASTKEDYRRYVGDYYKHYYMILTKELSRLNLDVNKILPHDEFKETCKLYQPLAKLIWLFYRTVAGATAPNLSSVATDLKLYNEVIFGNKRAWFITENFQKQEYRSSLKDIVDDIVIALDNEHISLEDCYEIIEEKIASNNYKFLGYKLKSLDERGGFLGDHLNLQIEIDTGTFNFFVKRAPTTQTSKEFADETGACVKEYNFFSKIVPDISRLNIKIISEVIPKCYKSYPNILIMEDLQMLGYDLADKRCSLTLETFKLGVKSLAKLHASSLIYEEQTGKRLPELYPNEFKENFYCESPMSIGLIEAGKKGIAEEIKMFSNYTSSITPEEFEEIAFNLCDNFRKFVKTSKTYRNSIVHSDMWANNIMFNFETKNAVLVDFQFYRYAPPAQDLMHFLYLSTDRKFRAEYTQTVIDYYYSEFKNLILNHNLNPDSILPYSEFLKSCEHERPFAITQGATHTQNTLNTGERMHEIFEDSDGLRKILFIDRSEHVRITAEKDPIYRQRNMEAIEDLRELCESYALKTRI